MTEAEMLYRLQRGEDMAYYKLLPARQTIVRKTPEETDLYFAERRMLQKVERLERPPED